MSETCLKTFVADETYRVEETHQEHHVNEKDPTLLDGFPRLFRPSSEAGSFGVAGATHTTKMFVLESGFSLGFHELERIRFGKVPSESYDQYWWCSAKPKQGSPSVRGGGNKLQPVRSEFL